MQSWPDLGVFMHADSIVSRVCDQTTNVGLLGRGAADGNHVPATMPTSFTQKLVTEFSRRRGGQQEHIFVKDDKILVSDRTRGQGDTQEASIAGLHDLARHLNILGAGTAEEAIQKLIMQHKIDIHWCCSNSSPSHPPRPPAHTRCPHCDPQPTPISPRCQLLNYALDSKDSDAQFAQVRDPAT
jgi:hypothetical protein